ncbi:sulfur carrier protein ThiS [Brachymonas sp. G13]|uniref:sulfur carrier protein ThiS n=1 Tax=Brachymonas TaxID=28219 RepID=UPI00037A97A4|nr:sulfur carrier protein ThiS [Brachymonas chironomi]
MTAPSLSPQIPDAAATLQLQLNGEPLSLPAGSTLQDLLLARGLDPASHATAVNGSFVARDARPAHLLQPGDAVTCFQAIVGG